MQARFKVSFSTQSAKSEQYRVVAGMICLNRCSATWSETMVACAALKQRIQWTPKSCMDRGFKLRRSHPPDSRAELPPIKVQADHPGHNEGKADQPC